MKFLYIGLRLPAGIALTVLALVVIPLSGMAAPALSDSPDKSERSGSPTNQFLTAYNSMSTADWLKEKGMRAEATDLYTEALNLFLKIAADYPQWQPAMVSFRVNYCRAALGGVERKALSVERGAPTDPPTPERFGGQATDDGLPTVAPGAKAGRQILDDNRQSTIENQKSEISNLSPLNFKLQQAALKERGRDYTGALAMYIALLEEYPQEPWALKGACRCCLRLGRMDQARVLTRQALTLSPDADLNLLAALVACHDGRYQAAIPLLHQSLKQNGACPEAHVALGVALTATGEIKEAQEEMKRALSLNPKLGDAFYNLARLSLRQKPTDHDTPRVHYQNALRHGATPDPELDKLLAE